MFVLQIFIKILSHLDEELVTDFNTPIGLGPSPGLNGFNRPRGRVGATPGGTVGLGNIATGCGRRIIPDFGCGVFPSLGLTITKGGGEVFDSGDVFLMRPCEMYTC